LNIAVEDRAPLPLSPKKEERFVLIKRNDPDYMRYYTIRAQHEYVGALLQRAMPRGHGTLQGRLNPNVIVPSIRNFT
jgi:hypothetical protein